MSVINANGICVYGQAVVDFGLCVSDGVSGYGFVTRGMVYEGPSVWYDSLIYPLSGYSLSTSWALPSGYSTVVTTWTPSAYGQYGEFPSNG